MPRKKSKKLLLIFRRYNLINLFKSPVDLMRVYKNYKRAGTLKKYKVGGLLD